MMKALKIVLGGFWMLELAKKVSLMELFYDLLFVYAIAKMTGQIHHLHHGILVWGNFRSFLIILASLLMIWMYQTLYNNLLGQDTFKDRALMAIKMFFIFYVANSINADFRQTFVSYNLAEGAIMLLLCLEFASHYRDPQADNRLIHQYTAVTGLVAILFFGAVLIGGQLGINLACLTIILAWVAPIPFLRLSHFKENAVNFPHLVERAGLLVIITFGEMITGITGYFTIKQLDWLAGPVFLILCALFSFYTTEFEERIEEHVTTSSGGGVLYAHFFVVLGLIMVTVSLSYLKQAGANHYFVINFLLAGLASFYLGTLAHNKYNRIKLTKKELSVYCGVYLLGAVVANLLAANLILVTLVIALMTGWLAYNFNQCTNKVSAN